jgi:hypothetical protein
MGIPSPVFQGAWATILAQTGGKVPKGAGPILDLRLALEPELGKDDACLIATYIGTGRSEANTSWVETGTHTAEEDCGCDSWIGGRTVAEAQAAMREHFKALPSVVNVLDQWAAQKAVTAIASVNKNVQEDVDKIKDKAANVAAGAVAAATGGAMLYFGGAALALVLLSRRK